MGFPDKSKWLYRASYRAVSVTSNGVRVTVHSGKYEQRYFYSHPDLVPHRGRTVAVFWNDYDPDTDAVIYTIQNRKPHELICVAPRVKLLPRFGAEPEQLRAEATRKSQLANMAYTECGAMAGHLTRDFQTPAAQQDTAAVGDQLAAAKIAREKKASQEKTLARIIHDHAEDILTVDSGTARPACAQEDPSDQPNPPDPSTEITIDELNELSAPEQSRDREGASNLTQNTDGTFDYQMQPSGSQQAQYVDYLLDRLTEFRKAGASFGQHHGQISLAVTRKIAKNQLGCDLHDETRFAEICAYLQSKINATILGKRNTAKGTANYHSFTEHTQPA